MRNWIPVCTAAAVCILAGRPALADTINFNQFGPDDNVTANGGSGTTKNGVSFTITGPGSGFTALVQGTDWNGNFASDEPLILDGNSFVGAPGPVTLDFATPIQNISGIGAQPDLYGPYTATLTAYDGSTILGTSVVTGVAALNPGSLVAFDFTSSSPDITKIVISTTDDSAGFGLGPAINPNGADVPEPGTWGLMVLGLGGLGAALRATRRKLVGAIIA